MLAAAVARVTAKKDGDKEKKKGKVATLHDGRYFSSLRPSFVMVRRMSVTCDKRDCFNHPTLTPNHSQSFQNKCSQRKNKRGEKVKKKKTSLENAV